MSSYDMRCNQIVHRAKADTDYTILIINGEAVALAEEEGTDAIGYYQAIGDREYVHNQYGGYSYYVIDGVLHSMHGIPDGMTALDINNGAQYIAYRDGDIASLVNRS